MDKPRFMRGFTAYDRLNLSGRARKQSWQPDLEEQPCCVYELVTRTRLHELGGDVEEVRDRINTLFWSILGTILIDIML